ncbi:MAG: sulfur carrier protein ThiS [Pseudomonadales bacterium]|jgi:sulfur carrier protein|nr:sulfur carrier protein ThiS [Pseudomonadales bacterium]
MQITLNGQPTAADPGITVAALITQLGLAGKRIAVEVNENIVPRSAHESTSLQAGDRVEIVHAIGGG